MPRYVGHIAVFAVVATLSLLVPLNLMPFLPGSKLVCYALSQVLACGSAVAVLWLFNNRLSRRSFSDIGVVLDGTAFRLSVRGAALGLGLITSVWVLMLLSRAVRLAYASPPFGTYLLVAALFVVQALQVLSEELLYRTYILKKLAERLAPWKAALLWGGVFGLVHVFGSGVTFLSIVGVAAAGFLLNMAYFRAGGNVWFPFGIHYAWNVMQMHVYFSPRLFHLSYSEKAWLGGGGNPEGSALSVLVVCGAAVWMWRARSPMVPGACGAFSFAADASKAHARTHLSR